MRVPRIYLKQNLDVGHDVELSVEAHRHVINVLRLRETDQLILFNGKDKDFIATIIQIEKKKSIVHINQESSNITTSPLNIEIGLSLIKSDKFDFAIQKSVELGVNSITPLAAERSTIKLDSKRELKKQSHWQGIIQSACEQSGRNQLPVLNPLLSISNWLSSSVTPGIIFEPTATTSISNLDKMDNVRVIIGPEGGFTDKELQIVTQHGFHKLRLGPRILRAETAAITAITSLQLLWGDLDL